MSKNKIFYIIIGFLVIVAVILWYFNLSFSLPTTLKEVVEERIQKDEQLTIANIDTERIDSIIIEGPTKDVVEIEDKDVISNLLNHELRIYYGGRFKETRNEYDLIINFYGSHHRYTIAEDYIKTEDKIYKVLDDNNEIFNHLKSLYEEK
ncbi:hypothetical protein [Ornithinibacillus sp. JPR2-1]|uniref:hypothetical protein n=1 Tax=Ornithinibacillus sp. JPR2-1 TaxID=2094019 RepID=UPI0031D92666